MHYYIFQDIYDWAGKIRIINIEKVAKVFSHYLAQLWKIHPFREGNTRTIVTFGSQFIESRGFYIDSDLFKDNAQYMRTALVAASAVFSDLGDKRKPEYLEQIVLDALERGNKMKNRVIVAISEAGYTASKKLICKIVDWNRSAQYEHNADEIRNYLR